MKIAAKGQQSVYGMFKRADTSASEQNAITTTELEGSASGL